MTTAWKADAKMVCELGGSFLPEQRPRNNKNGKGMTLFGSTTYTPEIRDEERRLVRKEWGHPRPDLCGTLAGSPIFAEALAAEVPGSGERSITLADLGYGGVTDALYALVLKGYTMRAYHEAKARGRDDVLLTLTRAVERLVASRIPAANPLREKNSRKFFADHAKAGCSYARRIMDAVTSH